MSFELALIIIDDPFADNINSYYDSTIIWNLIASYYNGLPYPNDGLMSANEPWSGHYEVKSPIWLAGIYMKYTRNSTSI